MKRQAGPPSTLLLSVKEAQEFSTSEETRGIGFFSGETDPKMLLEFMESGNHARMDVTLGHTTDPAVAKEMGFPLDSVVIFHPRQVIHVRIYSMLYLNNASEFRFVLYTVFSPRRLVSKYEPGYTVISELPASSTDMASLFITSRPLVGEMTVANFDRTYRHRPLLMAYYEVGWGREEIKGERVSNLLPDVRSTRATVSGEKERLTTYM